MEPECDSDTNCKWCTRYSFQRIGKGTGELGNKSTRGDHPNDSIVKIGQNNKNSSGKLRRLAVTQTPVKDHQLMLICKILKEVK